MYKGDTIQYEYSRLLGIWVKENNIKEGTTVKVTRKPTDVEIFNDIWVGSMDKMIGQTVKVKSLTGSEVYLEGSQYAFPFFVLEKVSSRIWDLKGKVLTYAFRGDERKFRFIRLSQHAEDGTSMYILLEEGEWVSFCLQYRGDEEVPEKYGVYELVEEGA